MEFKFLNFLKTGKEPQLRLYDQLDKIPAVIFYKILNEGDLTLLNPFQEKLPKTLNLNQVWINLLEKYYIATNKVGYDSIIRKLKQKEILRNKITACSACYLSLKNSLNCEQAKQTLVYFGINEDNVELIQKRIQREASLLKKFDTESSGQNKKESVNFWKLVSAVEDGLGRPISYDIEKITLAHWIELVKLLKEKNKKKSIGNGKRKN